MLVDTGIFQFENYGNLLYIFWNWTAFFSINVSKRFIINWALYWMLCFTARYILLKLFKDFYSEYTYSFVEKVGHCVMALSFLLGISNNGLKVKKESQLEDFEKLGGYNYCEKCKHYHKKNLKFCEKCNLCIKLDDGKENNHCWVAGKCITKKNHM